MMLSTLSRRLAVSASLYSSGSFIVAIIPFSLPDNTKVESPGHCIYCGAEGGVLTSEHVFPFFTGGTMELLGASCLACNKVTSRIDGYCAYRVMNGFRHHHGISSRTKSKPNTVPVIFQTATGSAKREIAFSEAPQIMILPEYDLPNLLVDGPRNGIVTPKSMHVWTTGDFVQRVEKMTKPGDLSWTVESGGNFELFLRFIAKTALAGAVGMLGYDSRKSPLGNVVLGKDKAPRYHLGGDGTKTGKFTVKELPQATSETTGIGFQKWKSPRERLCCWSSVLPWQSVPCDGVEDGEEFSGDGDDGDELWLAVGDESVAHGLEGGVVSGSCEGGHEQG